jgi:proteasome alpha subunit
MSVPFYVSPEQVMRDKADFARKGIARGRSVIVMQYVDGIVFVAENPSRALHKVSELYDRIGFAAVGKYNEFESLRIAGVRLADMRGYSYARTDVTGRSLANAYAQTLGSIFTDSAKPFEVEIVVAEVGSATADDQIYRLLFDGSVADERGYVVMGGSAEPISEALSTQWRIDMTLAETVRVAVGLLNEFGDDDVRALSASQLEVAVLDRTRPRRAFVRLSPDTLTALLQEAGHPTVE